MKHTTEKKMRPGHGGADSMRDKASTMMQNEFRDTPMESPPSLSRPSNTKMRFFKKGGHVKDMNMPKEEYKENPKPALGGKLTDEFYPRHVAMAKGGKVKKTSVLRQAIKGRMVQKGPSKSIKQPAKDDKEVMPKAEKAMKAGGCYKKGGKKK